MLRETPILRVVPKASVEQGMEAALELALSQWQYHEELWARNVKNAKKTGARCYGAGASHRHCSAVLYRVKPVLTYVICSLKPKR